MTTAKNTSVQQFCNNICLYPADAGGVFFITNTANIAFKNIEATEQATLPTK